MQLTVREAARILGMPERTLYDLIARGEIPAHEANGRHRFNRAELLEWVTQQGRPVPEELLGAREADDPVPPPLSAALAAGGIHYAVPGADLAAVFQAVVERMPLPPDVDSSFLCNMLLAREAMGSTAIGEGVALPHPRNPIVLRVQQPAITLCFLATPIPFDAPDGQPVHTLFSLISPTTRIHLHLLARLSTALCHADFRAALARRAPADEILAAAKRLEAGPVAS